MRWFLLCLLIPLQASAQIGAIFGTGPVSAGMGATTLKQGDASPFSTYGAPAALGFLRNVEVSAGTQYMKPLLKPFGIVVLNSNGTQGEFRTAGVIEGGGNVLGLAFPIGRNRPLTIGASFYLPMSSLVRVSGAPVNYPYYPIYNDVSRNLFFVVGAGYEAFDGWAIGVNMRSTTKSVALYALRADSTVNYSANAVEARGESRISFSVVYDNARRGGDPWSLGAMYRARAGLETKLSADISAFVPVQGELVSMPSYSPAEYVLMGSALFGGDFTVNGEVARVDWSKFVSPYGTGNINSYVIGASRKDANFEDIWVARAGAEYVSSRPGKLIRRIAYRAGSMYHPSPAPDQKEDSNFVDNDRYMFSGGLGLGFKNPWREEDLIELDLFAQYNWLKERTVRKNSSTNVGAPGYTSGGKILLYGAGGTIRF